MARKPIINLKDKPDDIPALAWRHLRTRWAQANPNALLFKKDGVIIVLDEHGPSPLDRWRLLATLWKAIDWVTLRRAGSGDANARGGMVEVAADVPTPVLRVMLANPPTWIPEIVWADVVAFLKPRAAPMNPLRDWLADFPFVEFDDFLGAIRLGRALAAKESDQIFVIEGPPGVGKTLLMEMLAYVALGPFAKATMPTRRSDLDKRMSAAGTSLLFDNVSRVPDWAPILASRAKVQIAITASALTIPAEVEPHVCRIRLDRGGMFDPVSARHPDILTFTTKNAAALRSALSAIRVLGGGPDEDAAHTL